MMVVDSSGVIAIFQTEDDAQQIADALEAVVASQAFSSTS